MIAGGDRRTAIACVLAESEEQLARDTGSELDWADIPADRPERAPAVAAVRKQLLSLRLDSDAVTWFREHGPGYQMRMNAVLRAFVLQQASHHRG